MFARSEFLYRFTSSVLHHFFRAFSLPFLDHSSYFLLIQVCSLIADLCASRHNMGIPNNGEGRLQRNGSDRDLDLSRMTCDFHCRMQIREALEGQQLSRVRILEAYLYLRPAPPRKEEAKVSTLILQRPNHG